MFCNKRGRVDWFCVCDLDIRIGVSFFLIFSIFYCGVFGDRFGFDFWFCYVAELFILSIL